MAKAADSKFDEMTAGAATGENPEIEPADLPANIPAQWSNTVDLPTEALQVPFLSLMQATAKPVAQEKAKLGQWYVEGFDAYSEVVIVPLQFGMSRRYSRNDTNGDPVTSCYAPTGPMSTLHGVALLSDGPGVACAECPLAKWQPNANGEKDERGRVKNDAPLCKESFDFTAYSLTHDLPVRVGFKSTGMKAGRLLATLGKAKGLGNFAVRLGSTKETGKRGAYAIPTVTILTGDEAEAAISQGQNMAALNG